MEFPDKIYVIGGFGSGKSFLANRISKIKNIPYFDLDDIRWVKKYSHKLSDNERKDKLVDILAGNHKRIIEGCVIDWADVCYTSADLIVLLKIPGYLAAWRIIQRYISRLLYGKHAGTFLGTLSLMYRAYMYYQKPKGKYSFDRHFKDCKKYAGRYIIIRDAKEILE